MGRVEENKLQKKNSLMDTAFTLFTSQGITKTSISDIVEKAGMAKGTFYLYFRDKYDLRDKLIVHKAEQLFRRSLEFSGFQKKDTPTEKLLAIIDDVLFQLQRDPLLLRFLGKNLSWSVFRRAMIQSGTEYPSIFEDIFGSDPGDQKKLEIEAYTIFEMVGSTCHNVILENSPVGLEEYLPWLHRSIVSILEGFRSQEALRGVL